MSKVLISAMFAAMSFALAPAIAQEAGKRAARDAAADDSDYYYSQPQAAGCEPNPKAIIQQKAMNRAEQRQARLAAMSWYGMSNSRPTAAPTPFTSLYSPTWQMPGGRPFAWYPSGRPAYVFVR